MIKSRKILSSSVSTIRINDGICAKTKTALLGNKYYSSADELNHNKKITNNNNRNRNFNTAGNISQKENKPQSWNEPKDLIHISTPIHLYNSLSKSKVQLKIVNRTTGNELLPTIHWYSCGPTVYDDTHLGHARNYVSLDIIYRILSMFFNYPVLHVMGITDVDDKILKRALEVGKIPSEISLKYELDFINDMKRLNVIQPSVYTRVTEHIDEVKLFIEEMERNGFTYVTNGGVYFNSKSFEHSDHYYGKLSPNKQTEDSIQQDHIEHKEDKKDPRDFALWKFTSKDFLGWESKWGFGRPGWHIECSAMIDHIFRRENSLESGATIDIHSGGIDLAFPHHNNEVAQSEARHHGQFCCSNETNWCNYFIHVGHLHIKGLKMSKSLKNFITVRDFLKRYTPDQFRIFCLIHQYNQTLDYNEDAIGEAIKLEKRIHEYLHNVSFYRNECIENPKRSRRWDESFKNYQLKISQIKKEIYTAICDDFNTPVVMDKISEMINLTNALYFTNNSDYNVQALELIESTSTYIIDMLNLFGLQIGASKSARPENFNSDEEIAKHPFTSNIIDILMEFRAAIRKEALLSDSKQTKILQFIDELRDQKLKEIGIRIDDRSGEKSIWRYDKTIKQENDIEKSSLSVHSTKLAQRQQEMEFKLSISIQDYFKKMPQHKEKNYSNFNEEGIPTHDAENQPLSKSAIKKLAKELEKHSELLEKHSK